MLPSKPVVAITLGDAGGIGPEVALRAAKNLENEITPIFFGPLQLRNHAYLRECVSDSEWVDCTPLNFSLTEGAPTASHGQAAALSLEKAIQAVQNQQAQVLVTAPISKTSMQLANMLAWDHTRYLSHFLNRDVSMAFVSPTLQVVLATVHIAYRSVPEVLNPTILHQAMAHAVELAKRQGIANPKIAVAGLNPHASENGLMGTEEQALISPAILSFNHKTGANVSGPYPPDTLFYRAHHGEFDGIVAMYHDQALIPVKLLYFDRAVNVTLGLPFIRTSPDHGTAFDLAYRNKASILSMTEAIRQAVKLTA